MATTNVRVRSPMDCFLQALIQSDDKNLRESPAIVKDDCAGHGTNHLPISSAANRSPSERSLSGLSTLSTSSSEETTRRIPPRWKKNKSKRSNQLRKLSSDPSMMMPQQDTASTGFAARAEIDESSLSEDDEPELPLLRSRWDESSTSSSLEHDDCSSPRSPTRKHLKPILPLRQTTASTMGSEARFRTHLAAVSTSRCAVE